jgi:hypothetical protein
VALCINCASCCFDTSDSSAGTTESGIRRVPLAESKPKRQPLTTPVGGPVAQVVEGALPLLAVLVGQFVWGAPGATLQD